MMDKPSFWLYSSACAHCYSHGAGTRPPPHLRIAILFASLYWISNAGAILFPGTAWSDPERAGQGLILGFPGAAFIGVVELSLLALALFLSRSNAGQKHS